MLRYIITYIRAKRNKDFQLFAAGMLLLSLFEIVVCANKKPPVRLQENRLTV